MMGKLLQDDPKNYFIDHWGLDTQGSWSRVDVLDDSDNWYETMHKIDDVAETISHMFKQAVSRNANLLFNAYMEHCEWKTQINGPNGVEQGRWIETIPARRFTIQELTMRNDDYVIDNIIWILDRFK